tara:strand:+ start:268 stop:519 length:252 start_codon:yes stop_codon:yes gene_type:complete
MTDKQITKKWTGVAEKALLNKRIIKVEYMPKEECERYDWYKRPITFFLDDGTRVIAQMDDEGNDGGVLTCLTETTEEVLPVLR